MTVPQWEAEVSEALAGSGWFMTFASLTHDMSDCLLEARHGNGEYRHVTINVRKFGTRRARQEEVRRLLSN